MTVIVIIIIMIRSESKHRHACFRRAVSQSAQCRFQGTVNCCQRYYRFRFGFFRFRFISLFIFSFLVSF